MSFLFVLTILNSMLWYIGIYIAQLAEQLICNQQVYGSSPYRGLRKYVEGDDAMAGMVQNVLGFIDEHFKLLYIIILAAIAVILMLIPSKKTHRLGIGIFVVLILLCMVYLVMMVAGAGIA